MKLKLVGTGSIGSYDYSASSLIDSKILIDCGGGTTKALGKENEDLNQIQVLLITHMHGDHILDIPSLLLNKAVYEGENLKIYLPLGGTKIIEDITSTVLGKVYYKAIESGKVEFIEYDKLDRVEVINGYFVTSLKVSHGIMDANGFIIENNGKRVSFSGDTSYCDSVIELVKNSNVTVLDTSSVKEMKSHMCLDEVLTIAGKYKDTLFIPTHMQPFTKFEAKKVNLDNFKVLEDGESLEF